MAQPVTKKFAWSYSALTGFELCARQYYEKSIAKSVREPESEAMRYGNYVHKALERRIRDGKPLPTNLRQYEKLAQKLAATPGEKFCELSLTFNADLKQTELFAKDAWLRAKLDLVIKRDTSLWIGDYKTGKRKMDSDQLELFAACAFTAYPEVDKIKTVFLWLPDDAQDTMTFTRADEPFIWQNFEPRVARMASAFDTGWFPETPSGICRGWCPVKTCKHWEPKK